MNAIKLDITKAAQFLNTDAVATLEPEVKKAHESLENGTCQGNDFLGWLHLPSGITPEFLADIKATAQTLRENCEAIVVAGIGGSYLGARAVIECLKNNFEELTPRILFAGNNISEDYLSELTTYLKTRKFGVINISKSGTTTETALTFRLLRSQCEEQRGKEEARKVIVAVTDAKKGAARVTADKEGYKSYVIPDNAAVRNLLYRAGKHIEILANYQPKLHYVNEWWKQLYGESEGKDNKGIFPAAVDLTTDLHSMGQWIQEGERNIFETVVSVEKSKYSVLFPHDEENLDGLNFLEGKHVDEVNKMAELGTQLAHVDGGVPNIRISVPELTEYYIGQLLYFFEVACGISGNLLGVNPFNQPGVESYKKNMFALLNKPGYEAESKAIRERLNK